MLGMQVASSQQLVDLECEELQQVFLTNVATRCCFSVFGSSLDQLI